MQIIVFTGGSSPKPEKAAPYFKNIFTNEKKPGLVIAADSGLESLRAYQEYYEKLYDFSPSLIVGDFDSLCDKNILKEYDSKIIEGHSSYKDLTDTELALKRAKEIAQGQECGKAFKAKKARGFFGGNFLAFEQKSFITLIGGHGGRADHFLGIFNLFGTKISPDAWLCGEQVLWKAERASFSIRGLKAGDTISICRSAKKNRGGKIISEGLEWESPLFRKEGMPSLSNTIKEEYERKNLPVQINFLRGTFVLILPLFASVQLNECNKKK